MGVDYDRSPKTRFTTRNSNKVIEKDDPLHVPTSSSSEHNDDNENISSDDEEIIKPVYTPEVKKSNSNFLNSEIKDDDVLGMKLEMFIGIVMGSLIVVIVAVGIVYNCFKKKGGEKDIELEFESESEDGESSDSEDGPESDTAGKVETRYSKFLRLYQHGILELSQVSAINLVILIFL